MGTAKEIYDVKLKRQRRSKRVPLKAIDNIAGAEETNYGSSKSKINQTNKKKVSYFLCIPLIFKIEYGFLHFDKLDVHSVLFTKIFFRPPLKIKT